MSAATYKITAVNGEGRPWPKDQPKTVYFDVEVDGLGKAGLGLLPSDAAPEVGQEILCRLQEGKDGKPPTLYPAKNGRPGGGGGRGAMKDNLSIQAQVAMKESGNLMVGFMGTGWKPSSADDLASTTVRIFKALNDALREGAK